MAGLSEQQLFLRILKLSEGLAQRLGTALEPFKLSVGQYSALEILRQAGSNGLACGELAQRLVARDPDITRLLDRLELRGLVSRMRERPDRRIVRAQITPDGLQLLGAIDGAVVALHARHLAPIGRRNLGALAALLEAAAAAA